MRAVAAVLVAVVVAGAAGLARGSGDAAPFDGVATWVDVYDTPVYADPEGTAARIAARGVTTVYAETANDRSAVDVVGAAALGRFVDALHARGIAVVAWYLPGFDRPGRDLRRTRAMLSFRTPRGDGFDGVALDVESTREKRVAVRTLRLLTLAGRLRAEAQVPVGMITLPPRMLERRPTLWPRFPWAALAELTDWWVPMAYTGSAFRGYEATYGYVARSIASLRAASASVARPIHAAGGVADRMSAEELTAFVDAATDAGVEGVSLYDFQTTLPRGWTALARFPG
jgi:hypothetical protein